MIIFGGPALGLVAIEHYPFLIEDRTIYIGGVFCIIFWFVASFAIFNHKSFPRGMPLLPKLLFRAGFALCMTFLLAGVGGIVNGYHTPLTSRDVAVVSKRTSRHSDPARRAYYLALRAWPPSQTIVELGVPREVYDRLRAPVTAIGTSQQELEEMPDRGSVRVVVGQGRLGLEWLKQISLPQGQ